MSKPQNSHLDVSNTIFGLISVNFLLKPRFCHLYVFNILIIFALYREPDFAISPCRDRHFGILALRQETQRIHLEPFMKLNFLDFRVIFNQLSNNGSKIKWYFTLLKLVPSCPGTHAGVKFCVTCLFLFYLIFCSISRFIYLTLPI